MDPITTAIVSWAVSGAGTSGVRGLKRILSGDRQQNALAAVVARAVDAAVDEVVAEDERHDVREALYRAPLDIDGVAPTDILSLGMAVSRVLRPRLEQLAEQGYEIDAEHLVQAVTRLITTGIQANADRGGLLAPLAEHMRHERIAAATEATAAASSETAQELRKLNRTVEALTRPSAAPASGTQSVGWLIQDMPGPVALGVHKAVSTGDAELPALPEYVPRSHDERLRAIIEAADQASMVIVLVGDSSTGKTRALWEAVRRLPSEWRVWSPAHARALREGLTDRNVSPRTAIWLNDAHNYIDPGFTALAADISARLGELVADPAVAPVLVMATLWPWNWQQLTAQPYRQASSAGRGNVEAEAAQVSALLEAATHIQVPSAFQGNDLMAVSAAADRDPRMALAVQHATSGKIAQYLAGAQQLLQRYDTAPPEGKALIDAAIDARRLGHGNQLPEELLMRAAPGYIDGDTWDQLADDWADRALRGVTLDWRKLPGPLTLIRPQPNEPTPRKSEYKLADVLEQTGMRDRRYMAPPEQFWSAVVCHAHAENLATLGQAAQDRARYHIATRIYVRAAAANDAWALHELALMREKAGDHVAAERLAARAANAGNCDALKILAMYRQQAGDRSAEERLYQTAVGAGDTEVLGFLPGMREEVGDHAEADRLALEAAASGEMDGLSRLVTMRAKRGDRRDAERLALIAAEKGDAWPLCEVGLYWESEGNRAEAKRLFRLAADNGSEEGFRRLVEISDRDGNYTEAERLGHEAAIAGHTGVLVWLARRRLDTSRPDSAVRLYRQAADMGDGHALGFGARLKAKSGDQDDAVRLATRAARAGNAKVLREFARQRFAAGDYPQAKQLAQKAADAGDIDALNILAEIRELTGDYAEAERLAIQAALGDEHWALDAIVEKREKAGDQKGAERLALNAANTAHIQEFDTFMLIQRPTSALWDLLGMRISAADYVGAERLAVKAAQDGHTDELVRLAKNREYAGDNVNAQRFYAMAADFGDTNALPALASMLKGIGDLAEAERVYQRAVNSGSKSALEGLAELMEEAGNVAGAQRMRQFGLNADGNPAEPWTFEN